jgi:hypothetical protein
MANTKIITLADRNRKFPLRGDMTGANLDFTPPDNAFNVHFYTEDAKDYTLTSTHKFFVNGNVANSFTMGGKAGLFAIFTYDPYRTTWVLTEHNLFAALGVGGTPVDVISDATIQAILNRLLPPGGALGYALKKIGSGNFAVGWLPDLMGAGGSGGSGVMNEVLVTPVNGEVTLDGAVGKSFRLVLNQANVKVLDPVNFVGDTKPTLVVIQGPLGPFPMGNWGPSYAFDDQQPPGLSSVVGGMNLFTLTPTYETDGSVTWITQVAPVKTSLAGFGKISPIARIGATRYGMLGNAAGTGAFNHVVNNDTVSITRSGKAAEATGTIFSEAGLHVTIAGDVLTNGTTELRPLLQMMKTDYSEGPPRGANRPSFGKQVLGAEGGAGFNGGAGLFMEIRDLRITGGRNDDGDCRGIGQNGQAALLIQNVDITDCNNGILTDNATNTPLTIRNCLLDGNGVGTPNNNANQGNNSTGYVHNIYAGHNNQTLTIEQSSIVNSVTGHDVKARCAVVVIKNSLMEGAIDARELDLPNGGICRSTGNIYHKKSNAVQNNLVAIGNLFGVTTNPSANGEMIDGTRPREYLFTNDRFINDVDAARDTSFVASKDTSVQMHFVDCDFVGAGTLAKNVTTPLTAGDPNYYGMVMTNGIYHMPGVPPIFTYTGGPLGPIAPVGKPANVPMTPAA